MDTNSSSATIHLQGQETRLEAYVLPNGHRYAVDLAPGSNCSISLIGTLDQLTRFALDLSNTIALLRSDDDPLAQLPGDPVALDQPTAL